MLVSPPPRSYLQTTYSHASSHLHSAPAPRVAQRMLAGSSTSSSVSSLSSSIASLYAARATLGALIAAESPSSTTPSSPSTRITSLYASTKTPAPAPTIMYSLSGEFVPPSSPPPMLDLAESSMLSYQGPRKASLWPTPTYKIAKGTLDIKERQAIFKNALIDCALRIQANTVPETCTAIAEDSKEELKVEKKDTRKLTASSTACPGAEKVEIPGQIHEHS